MKAFTDKGFLLNRSIASKQWKVSVLLGICFEVRNPESPWVVF